MQTIILSQDTANAVKSAILAENSTATKWTKATDLLIANGVTSDTLKAVKGGENDKLRAQVKSLIVSTFPAGDQALLAKDSKTLKEEQKIKRKTLQQNVGRYLALIESKLRAAEKDETAEADEGSSKTEVQRIQEYLEKAVTKLGKLENASFDVPSIVKGIKAIKGAMPAM
jgi:hypothetical protein